MKIVIAGGTGQVGAVLCRAFASSGHEVVLLSRSPPQSGLCRAIHWNGRTSGPWVGELERADVVINLAGRSVNCRYGKQNRREILESRVDSVHAIGQALLEVKQPPRVWLQAATATIYAHRFDPPNDEFTGIIGGEEPNAPDTWRFSIAVAKAWESAANEYMSLARTRCVIMRSAMMMSPDRGGIFATLLRLVQLGLGGPAGKGKQFVSWIHEMDFVRIIRWLIEREDLTGVINICSPAPLPNAEFMKLLRRAWGIPIGLPATKWMLEVGAFFIRTETELILKSRRVVPTRLLRSGFEFHYPAWGEAAEELCRRHRCA